MERGVTENQYIGGEPKKETWRVCRFIGSLAGERGGLGGGGGGGGGGEFDTPMHTMIEYTMIEQECQESLLSFRALCDSKLSGLCTFHNIAISLS